MNGNAGVRNIRIGGKPLSLSTTYKYRPLWRPHSSAVGASTAHSFCHTLSRTLPHTATLTAVLFALTLSLYSPSSSRCTPCHPLHTGATLTPSTASHTSAQDRDVLVPRRGGRRVPRVHMGHEPCRDERGHPERAAPLRREGARGGRACTGHPDGAQQAHPARPRGAARPRQRRGSLPSRATVLGTRRRAHARVCAAGLAPHVPSTPCGNTRQAGQPAHYLSSHGTPAARPIHNHTTHQSRNTLVYSMHARSRLSRGRGARTWRTRPRREPSRRVPRPALPSASDAPSRRASAARSCRRGRTFGSATRRAARPCCWRTVRTAPRTTG